MDVYDLVGIGGEADIHRLASRLCCQLWTAIKTCMRKRASAWAAAMRCLSPLIADPRELPRLTPANGKPLVGSTLLPPILPSSQFALARRNGHFLLPPFARKIPTGSRRAGRNRSTEPPHNREVITRSLAPSGHGKK